VYRDLPYPEPSSPAATAIMKGNRGRDTAPEVRVRSLLHRSGHRFRKNLLVRVPGLRRGARADIALTRHRVVVFVDGCFWHGCPEHGHVPKANTDYWGPKLGRNVRRDRIIDEKFQLAGWKVLRVWEHVPPEESVRRIVEAIHGVTSSTD
jgi:DNA mismatch endonuclease (patch repair protein)